MARHKWVSDCTVTESHCEFKSAELVYLRFTATIKGWRKFKIYEGYTFENEANAVIARVKSIKEKIESGDNSVFYENVEIVGIK